MWLKVLLCLGFYHLVCCRKSVCSYESVIQRYKRPTYEFSIRLLDRVRQETSGHFVFSPISTWVQLSTLAEGARGATLKELSKLIRHNKINCIRLRLKKLIKDTNEGFNSNAVRNNFIIIDKVFDVKQRFKTEAERSKNTKVLLLDFDNAYKCSIIANDIINKTSNGLFLNVLDPNDFYDTTILLVDVGYFKSEWVYPFNPAYTQNSPFYSEENNEIGYVNLMSQTGYFNITTMPFINAQVLELKCGEGDRISMLIFLSTNENTISELFLNLKYIRFASIFNEFETKLVKVMIPRFNIRTEVDSLPELIYDMGVTKIFYPDKAEFGGISDYRIYASLMTQIADIKVTEEGIKTEVTELLIRESVVTEFKANKPFGFILLDKKTELVLYAGIYSQPSLF